MLQDFWSPAPYLISHCFFSLEHCWYLLLFKNIYQLFEVKHSIIFPYVSVCDYLITLTLNYSFYQYSFLFLSPPTSWIIPLTYFTFFVYNRFDMTEHMEPSSVWVWPFGVIWKTMTSQGPSTIRRHDFTEVGVSLWEEVYHCGVGFEVSFAQAVVTVIHSLLPVVWKMSDS